MSSEPQASNSEEKKHDHHHGATCGHIGVIYHSLDGALRTGFLVDGVVNCEVPALLPSSELLLDLEPQPVKFHVPINVVSTSSLLDSNQALGKNQSLCCDDVISCPKAKSLICDTDCCENVPTTTTTTTTTKGSPRILFPPLPAMPECCRDMNTVCEKHVVTSCEGSCALKSSLAIVHDGHTDYLVQDTHGNYVLHHRIDGKKCVAHGVLVNAITSVDDLSEPLLCRTEVQKLSKQADYAPLFVASICDDYLPWIRKHDDGLQLLSTTVDDSDGATANNGVTGLYNKTNGSNTAVPASSFAKILNTPDSNGQYSLLYPAPELAHPQKNIGGGGRVPQEEEEEIEKQQALSRCTIHISEMCCAAEIKIVRAALADCPGLKENGIMFRLLNKELDILYDPTKCTTDELIKRLNDASLGARLLESSLPSTTSTTATAAIKRNRRMIVLPWYKENLPPWNVLLGLVLWLLSFLSFAEPTEVMDYFKYLSVVACALCLPRILIKCIASLKRRVMDVNCLMTLAVIGALALQDYEEAAAVVVLFSFSHYLESLASSKARKSLEAIVALKPDFARIVIEQVIDDEEEEVSANQTTTTNNNHGRIDDANNNRDEKPRVFKFNNEANLVSVETVRIDDVCLVRPGDKIPVDGVIIHGYLITVDESNLTGEHLPQEKKINDKVSAGTLNVGDTVFYLRATATSENSAVTRLVQLVQESQSQRSPVELMVERVAMIYTPLVVFIAFLLATIPFAFGTEVGLQYVYIALTLLVVACPCALVISTPISFVCGITAAAKLGILVKGGIHLQTLGTVQRCAFDKTGTITMGRFQVSDLKLFPITLMINSKTKKTKKKKKTCLLIHSTKIRVAKMCCKKEAAMIAEVLGNAPDVKSFEIDLPSRTVDIIHSCEFPLIEEAFLTKSGKLVCTVLEQKQMSPHSKPLLFTVLSLKFKKFCCKKEAGMIEKIMQEISIISQTMVDIPAKTVTIEFIGDFESEILPTLTEKGFGVYEILSRSTKEADSLRDEEEEAEDDEPSMFSYDWNSVLNILLAVEENSNHPLAVAVKNYAKSALKSATAYTLNKPQVSELIIIPGEGLEALLLDNRKVLVGNFRMYERVVESKNDKEYNSLVENTMEMKWAREQANLGATVSFLMVDGILIGTFAASDSIRPEAKVALETLKSYGISRSLLTGDNQGSADALARALQVVNNVPLLDKVFAALLPEDKVRLVKELQYESFYQGNTPAAAATTGTGNNNNCSKSSCCGRLAITKAGDNVEKRKIVVLMVGDGVNDAPAMGIANVAIAMGVRGSALAIETADVSIMNDDLRKVPVAISLGRETNLRIKVNIAFSLITKFIMIALSLAGYVSLGAAIGVDIGCMLIVTLNGIRLLRKREIPDSSNVPSGSVVANRTGDVESGLIKNSSTMMGSL